MEGIIILEGPDASGKTTLQQYLVDHYGAIAIHLTYNDKVAPRMFDYQTEEMIKAIELSKDHLVVVDRHWISEQVYAKVFRGGSPWPMMGRMMDRVWRKHAAIYILCLPFSLTDGVTRHRNNLDQTHPYSDEKFMELLGEYADFASDFQMRKDVLTYSIEAHGDSLDHYCKRVMDKVTSWRSSQYDRILDPDDQSVTGHAYDAKYIIIGEQINKKDNYFEWPFYEHRNSSLFLSECLAEIGAPETQIMWANVRLPGGELNHHLQHLLLEKRLKAIVFGDIAAYALHKFWGFKDFVKLPHPQWVKRFNHKESFILQLTNVLGGTQWR